LPFPPEINYSHQNCYFLVDFSKKKTIKKFKAISRNFFKKPESSVKNRKGGYRD